MNNRKLNIFADVLIVVVITLILSVSLSSCSSTHINITSGKIVKKNKNQTDTLFSGTGNDLYCVYMLSPAFGWISGEKGTILKTVNGGMTWAPSISGVSVKLFGIAALNKDTVVSIGESGIIIRTINKGFTWNSVPSPTVLNLNSVFFPVRDTGYICGNNGTIMKSLNGGLTWSPQSSGVINDLQRICFSSRDTGMCVGKSGRILSTVNGGLTWTATNVGAQDLFGMDYLNRNEAIAVGQSGRVLRTTDMGATWAVIAPPTGATLRSVKWCMRNLVYMVGDSGKDYRYNLTSFVSLPYSNSVTLYSVHSARIKTLTPVLDFISFVSTIKTGSIGTILMNNPEPCGDAVISLGYNDTCNWCASLVNNNTIYSTLLIACTSNFNFSNSCDANTTVSGPAKWENLTGDYYTQQPVSSGKFSLLTAPSSPMRYRFYLTDDKCNNACYVEMDSIVCCQFCDSSSFNWNSSTDSKTGTENLNGKNNKP